LVVLKAVRLVGLTVERTADLKAARRGDLSAVNWDVLTVVTSEILFGQRCDTQRIEDTTPIAEQTASL